MIRNLQVDLYDDGAGFDVSANDGVYTAAFTQFNGNGRYAVSAKVATVPLVTKIRTTRSHYAFSRSLKTIRTSYKRSLNAKSEFKTTDFIPSSGTPTNMFETEEVSEFTRVSEAGAFRLEGYQSDIDLIPPGRVTNLQVITTDEDEQIVELQWTAPGDDAFTGMLKTSRVIPIPYLFS